jgi:hypothetical protein
MMMMMVMKAFFHLLHSLLCLRLAICGDRLPGGSFAKIGKVYDEPSNGLSDP